MMKKEVIQHVEDLIKHYHEIKDEVLNGSCYSRSASSQLVAYRLERNLREFIEAIELIYEKVTQQHRQVIELMYWSDTPTKLGQVAHKLGVSIPKVVQLTREVVYAVARMIGWV